MDVQAWTLLVTAVGLPTSLVTLAVVLRTEFRERRRDSGILWSFNRFGTWPPVDGKEYLACELIQFGGTPTRVQAWHFVGCRVGHQIDEARLRSHIRGEDRVPLMIESNDPGSAWLLIMHRTRDDARWLHFDMVVLEPQGEKMRAEAEEALDRMLRERKLWRRRLENMWARVFHRPLVRPVGPTAYSWARIRRAGKLDGDGMDVITSLAREADPKGFTIAR